MKSLIPEIDISFDKKNDVDEDNISADVAKDFYNEKINAENIDEIILGPSPSTMFKINNNYFYQIIIKYKDTKKIINSLKYINDRYKNGKVIVSIDFNPSKVWKI